MTSTPLAELRLPTRAHNCVRRNGIETVEQLMHARIGDLVLTRDLGEGGLAAITAALLKWERLHVLFRESWMDR